MPATTSTFPIITMFVEGDLQTDFIHITIMIY